MRAVRVVRVGVLGVRGVRHAKTVTVRMGWGEGVMVGAGGP